MHPFVIFHVAANCIIAISHHRRPVRLYPIILPLLQSNQWRVKLVRQIHLHPALLLILQVLFLHQATIQLGQAKSWLLFVFFLHTTMRWSPCGGMSRCWRRLERVREVTQRVDLSFPYFFILSYYEIWSFWTSLEYFYIYYIYIRVSPYQCFWKNDVSEYQHIAYPYPYPSIRVT